MDKKRLNQNPEDQVPTWLRQVLDIAKSSATAIGASVGEEPASAAFRQKCRQAADAALSIARLRRERQRIGFVPISLREYVHGLFLAAELQASPVLRWLGVDDPTDLDSASIKDWARLAREIGMELRETLIHARIGKVVGQGYAPFPMLFAQRSPGLRQRPIEVCEAILRQIESEFSPQVREEFQGLDREIREGYGAC